MPGSPFPVPCAWRNGEGSVMRFLLVIQKRPCRFSGQAFWWIWEDILGDYSCYLSLRHSENDGVTDCIEPTLVRGVNSHSARLTLSHRVFDRQLGASLAPNGRRSPTFSADISCRCKSSVMRFPSVLFKQIGRFYRKEDAGLILSAAHPETIKGSRRPMIRPSTLRSILHDIKGSLHLQHAVDKQFNAPTT
jgi:hypothetical protein